MTGDGARVPVRSALFVDFDNIYLGLKKLDERAASAFATEPRRWLEWLETGRDAGSAGPRRFLVRNVYLNPATFGPARGIYTRAGFRAVDCPALTSQGKNSADINMVLDIMDALQASVTYDEFVIASADADFTPVLHRLRAQDRRITLLTAGQTASAYRAVCDSYLSPQALADVALGEAGEAAEDDAWVARMDDVATPSAVVGGQSAGHTPEKIAAIADAIRTAVRAVDRPLVSASAAHAARAVDPTLKASAWCGTGSFRAFMARHVADLAYVGAPPPGYVFDPARHSPEDVGRRESGVELTALQEQICAATGAPALSRENYAHLFRALSAELHSAAFNRNETTKRVRDRLEAVGAPVGRNSVNFVINGLIFNGAALTTEIGVSDLAEGWLANLRTLCTNAQMMLSPSDQEALADWIVGGLLQRESADAESVDEDLPTLGDTDPT